MWIGGHRRTIVGALVIAAKQEVCVVGPGRAVSTGALAGEMTLLGGSAPSARTPQEKPGE
jgi:hypothetical protein